MKNSRRKFIQQTTAMAAGASLVGAAPLTSFGRHKKVGANDQIRLGVIGCKGMGWSNMRSHLKMDDVECVAMADIDQGVLDMRAADVEKIRGKKPKLYNDYRKLLDDKDIDAVVIGTPDHWHCLNMIDACDAGKHVYVEKPLANSIEECRAMVRAARKYNRIVQVGQWQRSSGQYLAALDYIKSGKLGKIRLVKCWAYMGWMKPIPVQPDGPVPEGVDYKMWLGPAPEKPFNPNRFHFTFRWFWDYAGGLMTDWGVHEIDIALYLMGAKVPKSVMASGGKFAYPDDASETPDTLQAVYEYDGFNMIWEHGIGISNGNYGYAEGIAFVGNNATLIVNRGGWEIRPETDWKDGLQVYKAEAFPKQNGSGGLDAHTENFIAALKANDRSLLNCEVETGSVAAINAQMGNIAFRTGKKIYWNDAEGQFTDAAANAFIQPQYHNKWKFPKV